MGRAGRRGRRLTVLGLLAALVALLALPPVRDRVSAAAALAEAVGVDVPRPFAADVRRGALTLPDGVAADLWDAGAGTPGILLVPGAAPAGRDDDRVSRLAAALARSHVTVLVPQLAIYEGRFTEADLETLVSGVRLLHDRAPDRDVTMLGFSLGGSLALVAAADPRVRDAVGTVATFGAYADVVGMVQAGATGVSVVGDGRYAWEPPAQAREALGRLAVEVSPAAERDALTAALAGRADPSTLPPAARAAYDLVRVEHPDAVADRVAALPPAARDRLARFSPAAVADELGADVLALHSRDDPAVPFAELLRLRSVLPDARTYAVESFEHVDLRTDGRADALLRDLWTAWRFAGDTLAAAR